MKNLNFRNRPVEVPESIDELAPEQYIYYIYLASWLAAGDITPEFWRVRWFSYLMGLGSANYTILRPEYIEQAEQLLDSVVTPFIETTPQGPVPTFKTCLNLLPAYKGYSGPAHWLDNLTFGKFVECSTLLEQIPTAADPAELQRAVARALYNIPESDDVPPVLSFHAPMLFSAVWSAIQAGPIDINGRQVDFSIIFKSTGERRPDDKTGWAGISFEVAAAGVFGNIKELDEAPFWAVLMYLYKCKFEYLHDKSNKKP